MADDGDAVKQFAKSDLASEFAAFMAEGAVIVKIKNDAVAAGSGLGS